MKIYMVRNNSNGYCVYSEIAMNGSNSSTEAEALADFYAEHTFNPTDGTNAVYVLNADCTRVYRRRDNDTLFGTVLYEILSPNDTSTYEYW